MTEAQRTHWELLVEVDDKGKRLDADEIKFVGDLIDSDREGKLTQGEMARIRALHRNKVERAVDDDDEL